LSLFEYIILIKWKEFTDHTFCFSKVIKKKSANKQAFRGRSVFF
jgi:hypothetical protein